MTENVYQAALIKRIKERFPGCMVLKNDCNYLQGIPDLTVFYNNKWALLEVKTSENAKHQPNQDWYINWAKDASYGSFIYPENEGEVFNEMESAFGS